MYRLQLHTQHFILHASGAIFWEEQSCLLVADVHLGKSAHFRKNGSAIPSYTDVANYHKLDLLIEKFPVKRLLFLGDLFHSVYNSSWSAFADWVQRTPVKMDLLVGNHDVIPLHKFESIGMKTHTQLRIGLFCFTHHPQDQPTQFNFCGHLHPGYRLRGNGRQFLSLACFYQQKNQLILPAFGSFTGRYYVTPTEEERVFVLAEEEVFEV